MKSVRVATLFLLICSTSQIANAQQPFGPGQAMTGYPAQFATPRAYFGQPQFNAAPVSWNAGGGASGDCGDCGNCGTCGRVGHRVPRIARCGACGTDCGGGCGLRSHFGQCGSCGTNCGGACSASCGWSFGVEATYMMPVLEQGVIASPGNMQFGEFDWGGEAAPRIWFAWQNECGIGFRGRYWQLDAEANPFEQIQFTPFTSIIEAHSQLEMYTVDFEVTRQFHHHCWTFLGSFGLRHASIAHQYIFKSMQFNGPNAFNDVQLIGRRFDGTGVTFGLDMLRPIRETKFSFVCNARLSGMWGRNKVASLGLSAINGTVFNVDANVPPAEEDGLFIGEVQIGVEAAHEFSSCGGGVAFLRLLYEGQTWSLNDNNNLPGTHPSDSLQRGYVDVRGVTIAAGLRR